MAHLQNVLPKKTEPKSKQGSPVKRGSPGRPPKVLKAQELGITPIHT